MQHNTPDTFPHNLKITAWGLILLSVMAFVFMLQHPTIHAQDSAQRVTEFIQESGLNAGVHGALIGIMLFFSAAMLVYSKWRGTHHLGVALGLTTYAFGVAAMAGAAIVSGFVLPDMAREFTQASPQELVNFEQFAHYNWHTNQALAEFGTLCWLIAILAWGLDLFRDTGTRRWCAWISCGVSAAMILGLALGMYKLDVPGATLVLSFVCGWNLLVAYLFLSEVK